MLTEDDRQFHIYIGCLTIAAIIVIAIILASCSSEYERERPVPKNATDLHRYCLEYPKDSACQGKESR
jgi:hypothetical protein